MPEHHPKNVLVTGGAGFIGSNFIHHWLGEDSEVKLVDLDLLDHGSSLENLEGLPDPDRHVFVQGDICDRALVARLLREHGVDTVVHFAANSHVDRSISGPAPFIQTNFVGTFELLDACREYWLDEGGPGTPSVRFHHVSTDEVYGALGREDPAFTETTPYAPNSPYSASKAGSDHLVRAYVHTYGLPALTSNCSNNYGPHQHAEKLIPTIIRSCLTERPIPVYGDGSNIRDWLFVEDHCRAILAALTRGRIGETYNVGADEEWANLELVRHICGVLDELRPRAEPHETLISFVTDRPGHDWRYAIDSSKIHRELGWKPQETFESGMRVTLQWYCEHPARAGVTA